MNRVWNAGATIRWILVTALALSALVGSAQDEALVRKTPSLHGGGTVDGDLQVLTGAAWDLTGRGFVTGTLSVPGTPAVAVEGSGGLGATEVGTGASTPSGWRLRIAGGSRVGVLRTRVDPISLPVLPAVVSPGGTRSVNLNQPGASVGSYATLRDLTLNGNYGTFHLPPGAYGQITVNGGTTLVLGVAGSSFPATYNFQTFTVNGNSTVSVVGPVVVSLKNSSSFNGRSGISTHPEWFELRLPTASLTLNGGSSLYGRVIAPNGHVVINGGSLLEGGLQADRLTVNGGGLLRLRSGGANQAPSATAQAVTLAEDSSVAITLGGVDPEGASLSYTVSRASANGSLEGTPPNLTYRPNPEFNGSDTLDFTVSDGVAVSAPATVSLVVTPVNDRPAVTDRELATQEDTPVSFTVGGTDPDADALVVRLLDSVGSPAQPGALTGNGESWTYSPPLNFAGTFTFSYTARDGSLDAAPGQVTIRVAPVNDCPVATDLAAETPEDTAVTLTLAGLDVEGGSFAVVNLVQPQHGSVTVSGLEATYRPGANYNGPDAFSYALSDGACTSSPASVSLVVNPVPDAPVLAGTSAEIDEDSTGLALTFYASDADGDALEFAPFSAPTFGTLALVNGAWTYRPSANKTGTDHFVFTATDPLGQTSEPAEFTVVVRPINDAPEALVQTVTTPEDTEVAVHLAAQDVDNDTLTFELVTQPRRGALLTATGEVALPGALASQDLLYVPNADANVNDGQGGDSFTFRVNDGSLISAPATVTLNVIAVNDAPTAPTIPVNTAEDTMMTFVFAVSDIDGAGETLSVVGPIETLLGTIQVNGLTGTFLPSANVSGLVEVPYTVSDGALSATGLLSLGVTSVNDAPVVSIVSPQAGATYRAGEPAVITMAFSDEDSSADHSDVSRLEFRIGAQLLASVDAKSSPQDTSFTLASGTWTVSVVAIDKSGTRSSEASIQVTVEDPADAVISRFSFEASATPTVSLGADPQTGTAPLATQLTWTASAGALVSVTAPGFSSVEATGSASLSLDTGVYEARLDAIAGDAGELSWEVANAVSVELAVPFGAFEVVSAFGSRRISAAGQYRLRAHSRSGAIIERTVTATRPPQAEPVLAHWLVRSRLRVDLGADRTIRIPSDQLRGVLGPLIVHHDEWIFRDGEWGPSNEQFLRNALVFLGAQAGAKVLVISDAVNAPAAAVLNDSVGEMTVLPQSVRTSDALLAAYDVAIVANVSVEPASLSRFIRAGKGVFIFGGVPASYGVGVTGANRFLAEFGLSMSTSLDTIIFPTVWPTVSGTRLTLGVSSLYYQLGNSIELLDPGVPVEVYQREGTKILGVALKRADRLPVSLHASVWGETATEVLAFDWSTAPASNAEFPDGANANAELILLRDGDHAVRVVVTGEAAQAEDTVTLHLVRNSAPVITGPESITLSESGVLLPSGLVATDSDLPAGSALGLTYVAEAGVACELDSAGRIHVSVPTEGRYSILLKVADELETSFRWLEIVPRGACASYETSAPVLAWSFGRGGQEATGRFAGTLTLDPGASLVPGFSGSCLNFVGGASAMAGAYSAISSELIAFGQGRISGEFWVRPTQRQLGTLVSLGANRLEVFVTEEGAVRVYIPDSRGSTRLTSTADLVPLNKWTHIAFSADPDAGWLRVFVNGTLVAQALHSRSTNQSYPVTRIDWGRTFDNDSFSFGFLGALDEVALYADALSAEQIRSSYEAGAAGLCPASEGVAPLVNAGQDQFLSFMDGSVAAAILSGSVRDDGMPFDGAVSVRWRVLSGPRGAASSEDVDFADASSASTAALFSVSGVYQLELRASDGKFEGVDTLLVRVGTPCATVFPSWIPAQFDLDDDLIAYGSTAALALESKAVLAPGIVGRGLAFTGETSPARLVSLQDGWPDIWAIEVWVQSNQNTDGTIWEFPGRLALVRRSNDAIALYHRAADDETWSAPVVCQPSLQDATHGNWHQVIVRWSSYQETSGEYRFGAYLYVDGQAIGGAQLTQDELGLAGTGFTLGGGAWGAFSGVLDQLTIYDAYAFGDAAAEALYVAPDRCASTDRRPAIVELGAPISIPAGQMLTLPNLAYIYSTVLPAENRPERYVWIPNASPVSYLWRQVEGPPVTLNSPRSLQSTLSSPAGGFVSGRYVFELTATVDYDYNSVGEELAHTDLIVVHYDRVEASTPSVGVGDDMLIDFGTSLRLSAVASKFSGPVTWLWSVVSKPLSSSVAFSSTTIAQPVAEFSQPGVYELRAQASSGSAIATDSAIVTVLPRPNAAPVVQLPSDVRVAVSEDVTVVPQVGDDGIPSGSSLSYRWALAESPVSAPLPTLDALANGSLNVRFVAAGQYTLRLTVSDGELSTTSSCTVDVYAGANTPPSLTALLPSATIVLGPEQSVASLTVNATASDVNLDNLFVEFLLRTQGSPTFTVVRSASVPGGLATDLAHTFTGLAPGVYEFAVRAIDSFGATTSSPAQFVTVLARAPSLALALTSPAEEETVVAETPVLGYVFQDTPATYRLEYRPVGELGASWTAFASGGSAIGSPTTPAILGYFDPSLLRNGLYDLRVTRCDETTGSQTSSDPVRISVDGRRKIGPFTMSFKDLALELPGVPVELVRTYDSRDRNRRGDFGYGWSLGLGLVKIRTNRPLGEDWLYTRQMFEAYGAQYYLYELDAEVTSGSAGPRSRRHLVTLSFPDDTVHQFEARLDVQKGQPAEGWAQIASRLFGFAPYRNQSFTVPITSARFTFVPANARTKGTLELVGDPVAYLPSESSVDVGGLVSLRTGPDVSAPVFEGATFRYTTEDGTVYLLSGRDGLLSITDRIGLSLEVVREPGTGRISSLRHSDSSELVIVRDTFGRVTNVRDPYGAEVSYSYDDAGNLRTVTRPGQFSRPDVVTFSYYNQPASAAEVHLHHFLKSVTDPAGSVVLRSEYDDDGRLVAQYDALGHAVRFQRDEANVEKVVDALGYITRHTYDVEGNITRTELPIPGPDGVTPARIEYAFHDPLNPNSPTRTADATGRISNTFYDAAGCVISQVDGLGNRTNSEYDEHGNPTAQIDALGRRTTMAYFPANATGGARLQPSSITDALGNTTTFLAYDASGNPTVLRDALGHESSSEFDSRGRLTSQTDAEGHRTESFYYADDAADEGARGKLERTEQTVTRSDGTTVLLLTRYFYDTSGRVIRTELPGHTAATPAYSETDYDANGRAWRTRDALGRTTTTIYNERGEAVRTELPAVTRTLADGTTVSEVHTEQAVFDAAGRRILSKDAADRWTRTVFDALGRVIATYHLGSQSPARAVDDLENAAGAAWAMSRPVSAWQLLSATRYDAAGRVLDSYDAAGYRTHTEYDLAGRQIAITPRGSQPAAITLNVARDGLQISEPAASLDVSRRTTRSYLASGQLATVTDAGARTTTFGYDELGRRISTTLPDLSTTRDVFDAAGRRERSLDAENRMTVYGYDAMGRLQTVTDAAGRVTSYGYNEAGWQTSQTDALGRVTRYAYDEQGRRVGRTLPDAHAERLRYDEVGQVVEHTDFNGETTTFRHDERGRLIERRPAVAALNRGALVATFSYTADGQRASQTLTSGNGETTYWETYRYDDRGRLWLKRTPVALLRYGYDARSNLREIASLDASVSDAAAAAAVATGVHLAYGYDSESRLALVEDRMALGAGGVRTTRYGYTAAGALGTVTLPNGVTVSHGYTVANGLSSLRVVGPTGTLALFDYRLRPGGHRMSLEERIGSAQVAGVPRRTEWTYDATYRLTGEYVTAGSGDGGTVGGTAIYEHDAVGNRQARRTTGAWSALVPSLNTGAYVYDVRDRLTGVGAQGCNYDDNGSTTSAVGLDALPGSGGATRSVEDRFDEAARLIHRTETTQLAGGQGTLVRTITLLYDADGNRVCKTVSSPTGTRRTWYVVDTLNPTGYAQVLEELEADAAGGASLAKAYVYGLDLIGQHVWTVPTSRLPGGAPAAPYWRTSYHGYDGLGSVRYLTNAQGALTDTYSYDAYGILLLAQSFGPLAADNTYCYAGEPWDEDLGLSYNRARYLNPTTGRFWTQDTYEGVNAQPASLHKYLYAHADPVNGIDPSGYFTQLFGYLAEQAIGLDYLDDHPESYGYTVFGRWTRLPGAYRLKPDIFDLKRRRFAEVKPLSLGGIAAGVSQVGTYTLVLAPLGYLPEVKWPHGVRQTFAGQVPIAYFNIGGVIFYTDVTENAREIAAITSIALARHFVRANALRLSAGLVPSLSRGLSMARIAAGASNAALQARVGLQTVVTTFSRGLL